MLFVERERRMNDGVVAVVDGDKSRQTSCCSCERYRWRRRLIDGLADAVITSAAETGGVCMWLMTLDGDRCVLSRRDDIERRRR